MVTLDLRSLRAPEMSIVHVAQPVRPTEAALTPVPAPAAPPELASRYPHHPNVVHSAMCDSMAVPLLLSLESVRVRWRARREN
jgi:hypothetical protein